MAIWRDDIVVALEVLDGKGTYPEIYAEVAARRSYLPPNWKAIIRRTIEQASSDTDSYRPGATDLFYSVRGLGHGVWGLRLMPDNRPTVAETGDPQCSAGQGYASDSVVKAAIENHAVQQAKDHYRRIGARDLEEHGKPFDLKLRLDGAEIHVEVKGSTRLLSSVTLTRNEVADARQTGTNHLFVVDQIKLTTGPDGAIMTSGGRGRLWTGWTPSEESLTPMVYSHLLPGEDSYLEVAGLTPAWRPPTSAAGPWAGALVQ
jgi:hypothetical protein